jgi:hypothetical protein
MSGSFPPSHTWPVAGPGLAGRIAAAVSAAVHAEMVHHVAAGAAVALPPLVWDRAATGGVVGVARETGTVAAVELALLPWARALDLTRQPAALSPVAGAIEFAGMVDDVHVRVWGLTQPTPADDREPAGP